MTFLRKAMPLLPILLLPHVSQAQLPKPETIPLEPVPELKEINAGMLHSAARAAMACGTEFLISQMGTNEVAFLIRPRKITVRYTEKKTVDRRYRQQVVERPIYSYKWEYYENYVTVKDPYGGPSKMKKVKQRRLVSKKKTGTRKETVLVLDPEGPIVRPYTYHAGPVIGHLWQPGYLGQNAMALLALTKAGIGESNQHLSRLYDQVRQAVVDFGLPDTTWDLAWIAAAFSNLDIPDSVELRDKALKKLLSGQISEGDARGMWGPVCIDMKLLCAVLAQQRALSRDLKAAEGELEQKPKSKVRHKRVAELQKALDYTLELLVDMTQQGHRFQDVTQRHKLTDEGDWLVLETHIAGLPYFFYNQQLADMDSTALALYAIREAAERGQLPEEISYPGITKGGKPYFPVQKAAAILARTASTISRRQAKDGQWDEGKIHEPATLFVDAFQMPAIGKDTVLQMRSAVSHLSTAQAFGALMDTGRAVGMEKLLRRYARNATLGKQIQASIAQDSLAGKEDIEIPITGNFAPYELTFRLGRVHRVTGNDSAEHRRDLWTRLVFRLVRLQNGDGSWGEGRAVLHTPSAIDYLEHVWKEAWDKREAQQPEEKRRPFSAAYTWRQNYWRHVDSRLACTAYAILFLAEGIRPPIAAYVPSGGTGAVPKVLRTAIDLLRSRKGRPARVLPLDPAAASLAEVIPTGFFTGTRGLSSPAGSTAAHGVLGAGGTVIVEIPAGDSIQAVAAKLAPHVSGGTVGALPPESSFLAPFKSRKPNLQGISRDNDVAAVFLPWRTGNAATGKNMTYADAVKSVYYLLDERFSKTGIANPDYPLDLEGIEDPFALRAIYIAGIRRQAVVPQPEPAPVEGQPEAGPGTEVPEKPEPKKPEPVPEDERW